MKKILSILVMVLFGVTSVWAQTVTSNLTVNVGAKYSPAPSDILNVNLCESPDEGCDGVTHTYSLQATAETPSQENFYNDKTDAFNNTPLEFTVTCYVSTEMLGMDNEYVFSHWAIEGDGVSFVSQPTTTSGFCTFKISKTQSYLFNISKKYVQSGLIGDYRYTVTAKTGVTSNVTITAVWVQPQVTGVDNANYTLPKVTDVNDLRTQDIVFSLANDVAKSNYACQPTGDGFSLNNTAWNTSAHTYTATAAYTPSGVHGTHTGTVTLTSNHPSSNPTSATSTLTVEEDYTPAFTMPATFAVSTQAQPTYVGAYTQLMETDIVPTGLNYAAAAMLPLDATEKKNGSVWDIQLTDNPSSFFSLEPFGNTKVIRFTPTGTVDANTEYTAKLQVKCTYYDALGKPISTTKDVILTAYAKNDANERLEIEGGDTYAIDFGNTIYGTPYTQTVSYVAINLVQTPQATWTATSDQITYANYGSSISISLSKNLTLGQHTARLVYTSGSKTATLNISANVILGTPELNAYGGLSQVTLTWSSVYGADKYIIKRGGTTIKEITDPTITSYVDANLTNGTAVSYTVTAVYTADESYNTTSNEATATPNMPTTITADDVPYIGLYTGTDIYKAGHATYGKYPYNQKRAIDLTAAFDENGNALFSQLFIFGFTTNDDATTVTVDGVTGPKISKPSATTNSNAVTPCYIYTKSGNNYTLSKTISNVNIATKPTEFNITDMSKSYYFTGYAPYASCGSTWEENAVFLFTSSGNSVNLYFDNLELYARPKAATGNKVPTKTYTANGITEAIGLINDPDIKLNISPLELYVYVQGSGAAVAFASTSTTAFQPTIHLRGMNVLESTAGVTVHVTSSLLSMDASASQQSSPIQVLLKKDGGMNSKTTLTITDIWVNGTTHTNGILDLANLDVRPAPTIDLGNANTTLNFNGGQYFLSNAANTSTAYTVSFAISYRKKSMASGRANMFGLGDDQPEGKVRFNDGSVNCSVLPKAYFNESLYHNQTSMKCPQDTKIDGGTFNCDVLSCTSTTSKGGSPTNTAGQALCMVEIPIEGVDNTNGTAILKTDWMDYALANGANTDQLDYYGIKSMTPTITNDANGDDIQVVNLMLPSDKICFMDMVRIPWVLCTPDVTVQQTGVTETLGGNKEVESSIAAGDEGITNVKLTARLLYAELDDYTKTAVEDYTAPGGYSVTVADATRRHVQNTDSYLISDKIYWVRPVVANQWQMIVPPFDVANVYIVESYPEEQLLKDFGTLTTNKIGQEVYVIDDENKIYNARIAQAKSMMDLVYYWMYDADPAGFGNDNDLWPKKGWDMSKFVREWVDYEVSKNGDNKAYQPIIEQLYHFTGSNWDANYYLYESSGEWVDEGDKFVTDWQLVQAQSVKRGTGTPKTIMHKGDIYAMSFPYSIYNDGFHNPDEVWDYWTGKYIIMEGYPTETNDIVGDVQVLSGTNTDWNGNPLTSTVLADFTTAGRASLRGNSTFGELIVQKENALVLPEGGNTFRRSTNHTLAPGEGFMLANAPATPSPMPRRIASIDMMTGDVTYEPGDGSENTVTGTPTIAGEREMLVYTVAGGLGVVPVVPQHVSIYNAAGQLVVSQYLTDNTQFALPTGIYLVRGEKDQAKAMVK